MSDGQTYVNKVQLAFISSPIIKEFQLIRSWVEGYEGFFRIRATLANQDFLESAEYFVILGEGVSIVDYRHQWMNESKTRLHRRWDNTPHFPNLDNFPHHIHLESEENVLTGDPITIFDILNILESLILAGG